MANVQANNDQSIHVRKRAEKAKIVAEKYQLPLVEMQSVFDKACEMEENSYWLRDGVHPTAMGHQLLKQEWLKTFNDMEKKAEESKC